MGGGGGPGGGDGGYDSPPASELGPTKADDPMGRSEPTFQGKTASDIGEMADALLSANPDMSPEEAASIVASQLGLDPGRVGGGPSALDVDEYGEHRGAGRGGTAPTSVAAPDMRGEAEQWASGQTVGTDQTIESILRAWGTGIQEGGLDPADFETLMYSALSGITGSKAKSDITGLAQDLASGSIDVDQFTGRASKDLYTGKKRDKVSERFGQDFFLDPVADYLSTGTPRPEDEDIGGPPEITPPTEPGPQDLNEQRGETLLPGLTDTDVWRKSLLGRQVQPLWTR